MSDQIPKGTTDVDRLTSTPSIQPGEEHNPSDGKFASLMKEPGKQEPTTATSNQPTPMDVAGQGKLAPSTPPSLQTIQAQMNSTSSALGDVKNQLHTKGLKLRQSEKQVVRRKLTDANNHIRGAAEHAGVDTGKPIDLKQHNSPISKFLAMVADGQTQMNSAAAQLQQMNTSGGSLNAGEMLLIQVKLQKAQQELDYTSMLLGKSIDMVKNIFSVQI